MKLQRTLNVPVAYFYSRVIDSVLYDIRQYTGNQLTADKLQGYHYEKKFGRQPGEIIITKNVENKSYAFDTKIPGATYHVSYELAPTGKDQLKLDYQESSAFNTTMGNLNQMLMGLFLGPAKKRRLNKMLTGIEKSYTEN